MGELANEWSPRRVSAPGSTLLETIESLGLTQAALAQRMGRPKKTINEIIKGKASITAQTALELELVLGVPASFWLERQRIFDEATAREDEDSSLLAARDWLTEVPYRELVRRKWLPRRDVVAERMRDALHFYGCGSVHGWRLHARDSAARLRHSRAYQSDPVHVSTWLRRCDVVARSIDTGSLDREALRSLLAMLRQLGSMQLTEALDVARRELAQHGVALVWVPPLKGSKLSGAAFSSGERVVVALTLRNKSDDHVWFTLMHELGHVLLHDLAVPFVDDDVSGESKEEREADAFAREVLIPDSDWRSFVEGARFSHASVTAFARRVGIAPGIVVGRLQHDRLLPPNHLNALKRFVAWDGDNVVVRPAR